MANLSNRNKNDTLSTLGEQVTLTQTLSQYYSKLGYSDLPLDVIWRAKMGILDTVGAALYGVSSIESQSMLQAIQSFCQDNCASIWGTNLKSSLRLAALNNSVSAAASELDDVGNGHNGAVVVPAVLSVAENLNCSGKKVLVAVVTGYEIARRILDGAGGYNQHNGLGWHGTGTVGSFGAAAAVARLLDLSVQQMTSALGIAGSFTGGTWAFMQDGSMTKRLNPGKAAENGIGAAFMAKAGFQGPKAILEAEWGGFYRTYDQSGKTDPQKTLNEVGEKFHILRSGFKRHACCAGIHGALDALLDLMDRNTLTHNQVDHLQIVTSAYSKKHLGKKKINSCCDAQLSLPYSLSVMLLSNGETGPDLFTIEKINDPEVQAWCQRVEILVDQNMDPLDPHIVKVFCKDGRQFTGSISVPKGEPENPMSQTELEDKYYQLSQSRLSSKQSKDFASNIINLEKIKSMKTAMIPLQL
jgi:2-methylcitrate dehydratase PrpD